MPIVDRSRHLALGAWLFAIALSSHGCQLQFADLPISEARPPRDAGDRDARTDGTTPNEGGLQVTNPGCERAFPSPTPAEPTLPVDPTGRPAFDWWRDLDCAGFVGDPACSTTDIEQSCSACLGSGPAKVCAGPLESGDCSGPEYAVATLDSDCTVCLTLAAKARACCAADSGVDCRAWPYEHTSARGELCARHADCEPGLICASDEGWSFGLCTCPERLPEIRECAR